MRDDRLRFATLGFVVLLHWGFPRPATACEPIIPLVQLFAGSNLISHSLLALAVAVTIKTILFVSFERRLPWYSAATSMILGNVFSTIIGLLLAIAAGAPLLILPFVVVVFVVSLLPARRLTRFNPWGRFKRINPPGVALGVSLLYLATFFLFAASQGVLFHQGGGPQYWIVKLTYVYVGLAVSLFLTATWEEAVVGIVAGKRVETPYFLPSVLRANLYTMLLVFAYATIEVIPRRLASHDFLISQLLRILT